MRVICSFASWLVLSLIWTLAVAASCWMTWPAVPLDMSASDPATVEALRKAGFAHALRYGILAAVPPAIALIASRFLCPGRRDAP